MKQQSFFRSLSKDGRFMVSNLFFLYLVQGVFVIALGSLLPMIKAEYNLSYGVGGALISAHSAGNLLAGLFAGLLPLYIGYRRALLWLNILPYLGFAMMLITGNPLLLVLACLLTGLGRGAVGNYDNQIINRLSGGSSGPLNMLHGFFALGAVGAPFLVLFCTRSGDMGWRYAVYVILALGIATMITSPCMNLDSAAESAAKRGGGASFAFLRDRQFLRTIAIMLFYLAVEASVMGWLVTYFVDSGSATAGFAQVLTSLLWVVILVGRCLCALFASRLPSHRFLLFASGGILVFLVLLLVGANLPLLLLSTVGLGLCMAGMYGTTVSNATGVFVEYPMAMGVFVTITGIGSIIAPSLVGVVASSAGIRIGMSTLLVPALLLLVSAACNHRAYGAQDTAK